MLARLSRALPLAIACVLLTAAAARADLYTIAGVPVDVRAESAAAAQAQGLAAARAAALLKLMQRLTREIDHPRLPSAPDDQIQTMIDSFQVVDEKRGPDRYIASVSFEFSAQPVKALLALNQIEYTESRSRPALMVPVMTIGGEPALWNDPNLWLDAWAGIDASQHLVPPLAPFGDIEDVVMLSADQALGGDEAAILALADRYEADTAFVLDAALVLSPDGGSSRLSVQVTPYGSSDFQPFQREFESEPGAEVAAFLATAAEELAVQLDNQWKEATVLRFSIINKLTALAPVSGLQDWLDLSRTIEGIHVVRSTKLRGLTVRDALIELEYGGDPEDLQKAMRRAGLDLQPEDEGFWLLLRGGATQ
ncbi:MAG: DUF2066 domain-containing protein [Minwuia sp.]|uniref:DUF2066 domain-containing protein n=1 Tax=Minwuia sp. TaxID=2493630 RepID=UPI003A8AD2C2